MSTGSISSSKEEQEQERVDDWWDSIQQHLTVGFRSTKVVPVMIDETTDEDETTDGFVAHQPASEEFILKKKLERFRSQVVKLQKKYRKSRMKRKELELKLQQLDLLYQDEQLARELIMSSSRTNHSTCASTPSTAASRRRPKLISTMIDVPMDELGYPLFLSTDPTSWRRIILKRIERFLQRIYPMENDIKQVEARFGTSVSSYFVFFRWIVLIHVFATIPTIALQLQHVSYIENPQDWTKLQGFTPWIFLISSFQPDEALSYAIVLLVTCGFFVAVTIRKWYKEDRKAKFAAAMDQEGTWKYSKMILNSWDFALRDEAAVADMKTTIAGQLTVAIHDAEIKRRQNSRTRWQKFLLFLRRSIGSLAYITLQASGWFIIIVLTTRSGELESILSSYSPALAPYAAGIVPAAVTLINAILPQLISFLTKFESWDDAGFAIKAMVVRLFLAKMMNVFIQLFSYVLLLDPFYFTDTDSIFGLPVINIRQSTEKQFSNDAYPCRLEQVAFGLITLAMTEFFVSKLISVSTPLLKNLISYVRKKEPQRTQFLVAHKMVALLYFQSLLLMSFPLAPATIVPSLLMLTITFKYDKWILLKYRRKPVKPWNAKSAGNFFIKFYFVTVLLYTILTHLFLTDLTLPKKCQFQDNSHLCATSLGFNNTCTIDPTHPHAMHLYSSGICDEKIGYPACLCSGDLACGPFVIFSNGYAPLFDKLSKLTLIGTTVRYFTTSVAVVWMSLATFVLLWLFRGNSLKVAQIVNVEREMEHQTQFQVLNHKLKTTRKKLQQLQRC